MAATGHTSRVMLIISFWIRKQTILFSINNADTLTRYYQAHVVHSNAHRYGVAIKGPSDILPALADTILTISVSFILSNLFLTFMALEWASYIIFELHVTSLYILAPVLNLNLQFMHQIKSTEHLPLQCLIF